MGKFCLRAGLALFLWAPLAASARNLDRDPRGEETVNYWTRYGEVRLELDRTLYEPGQDAPVRISVRNRGYQVIRIYPATRPNQTFQFLLSDRQGREQPLRFNAASYAARERGEETPVVDLAGDAVKEIILHPGESFEKTLYLNDFFRLEPGAEYRLIAYFYPDSREQFFVRSANTVQLRLDRRRENAVEQAESRPEDARMELSPEETVYLFLSAEMRANWQNYLKYVDLRKYITSYDRFAARYVQAGERERAGILEEFARYLTTSPADRLRRFQIVSAAPERDADGALLPGGRAFVRATALREAGGFSARYEYAFTLERGRGAESGFWKIVQVEARLLR